MDFFSILGIVSTFISGVIGLWNTTQQSKAYSEQHELNQQQLAFSKSEQERSQYNYENGLQIRVNDAKQAGLSPLAAVGNVGSSSVVSAPQRSVGQVPQVDTSVLNNIVDSILSGVMSMKLSEQQHGYKMAEISKQGEIDKELAHINAGASKYTADSNYNVAMAELDEAIRVHDYDATVQSWNEMMSENELFGLYGDRYYSYDSFVHAYDNWRADYSAKVSEIAREYGVSEDSLSLGASVGIEGFGVSGNFGKYENGSKVSYAIQALKSWADSNPPPVPAFRTGGPFNHGSSIRKSTVDTTRR